MRSLIATLGVYLLVFLLAGSFPLGTGEGAHRHQLLHPVLPHLHLHADHAHGEVTLADNLSLPVYDDHRQTPAFGAGVGAAPALVGLAVVPTVSAEELSLPPRAALWRLVPGDDTLPSGLNEAPLTPPPTA